MLCCNKCITPQWSFRPVSIQVQLNLSCWSTRHENYQFNQCQSGHDLYEPILHCQCQFGHDLSVPMLYYQCQFGHHLSEPMLYYQYQLDTIYLNQCFTINVNLDQGQVQDLSTGGGARFIYIFVKSEKSAEELGTLCRFKIKYNLLFTIFISVKTVKMLFKVYSFFL